MKNSRWIQEMEAINRVHHMYNAENWRHLNHYVFWFHDSTFECVAKSYTIECYRENMADMLARITQRLLA